jgi:chemotaxis protein MotA
VDLATLLGLVVAWGLIIATIMLGAAASTFINLPSVAIVIGGTFAVVLMRFTLGQFIGSLKTATKAFLHKSESPEEIIESVVELASIARKEGLLALERQEISNPVLQKGINLLVDGHEPSVVKKSPADRNE